MGKGFTLVEITIVMLIIGVIAALAIKGKDLVEVANVRAELRKLEKFDLAIKTVVLKKSKSGSAGVFSSYAPAAGSEILPQFFTDNRSLEESDFITYLVPESMKKSVLRRTPYNANSDISVSVRGIYTPQEACMVELVMDDMHANSGRVILLDFNGQKENDDGSISLVKKSANNNTEVYNDCAKWLNAYDTDNNVTLFYRVL